MLALSLVLIVVSASPAKPVRENKRDRAARLMTDDERRQLAAFDAQLEVLGRPGDNTGLLIAGITTLSFGVVVPVVLGVVGIVGTVFVGLFGLLVAAAGSPGVLAFIPTMWVALFSWIPVWGWIAMGVVAVAGAAMLIGAQVSDAPRRDQVHAIKTERKQIVDLALSRPDLTEVPTTPLFMF